MKLSNLIWVLALAGATAACNSGPAISGCTIDPATGLCSTVGGECGPVEQACTNPDDAAVYMGLTYTDEMNEMYTGADAASAIAGDCISGAPNADPPIPIEDACGNFVFLVLSCGDACPDCTAENPPAECGQACTLGADPDECGSGFICVDVDGGTCTDVILGAGLCVAGCAADIITEVSPPGLSEACLGCYGTTVACGAAFCLSECAANPDATGCIECRCNNNCIQCFDVCSGLEGDNECG